MVPTPATRHKTANRSIAKAPFAALRQGVLLQLCEIQAGSQDRTAIGPAIPNQCQLCPADNIPRCHLLTHRPKALKISEHDCATACGDRHRRGHNRAPPSNNETMDQTKIRSAYTPIQIPAL
jgi:hypothetical protein